MPFIQVHRAGVCKNAHLRHSAPPGRSACGLRVPWTCCCSGWQRCPPAELQQGAGKVCGCCWPPCSWWGHQCPCCLKARPEPQQPRMRCQQAAGLPLAADLPGMVWGGWVLQNSPLAGAGGPPLQTLLPAAVPAAHQQQQTLGVPAAAAWDEAARHVHQTWCTGSDQATAAAGSLGVTGCPLPPGMSAQVRAAGGQWARLLTLHEGNRCTSRCLDSPMASRGRLLQTGQQLHRQDAIAVAGGAWPHLCPRVVRRVQARLG